MDTTRKMFATLLVGQTKTQMGLATIQEHIRDSFALLRQAEGRGVKEINFRLTTHEQAEEIDPAWEALIAQHSVATDSEIEFAENITLSEWLAFIAEPCVATYLDCQLALTRSNKTPAELSIIAQTFHANYTGSKFYPHVRHWNL